MGKDLLTVRGLKTYFYTRRGVLQVVDDIDLNVKEGETIGLVGESGCGKSTTALSIMGLVPSPGKTVSGKVLYKDQDLLALKEDEMSKIRGKDIAMVFQDPQTYLNPVLTVGKQINETIRRHRKTTAREAKEYTVRILESVGISAPENVSKRFPHELSGGMRQRCLIAMALVCSPSLLIADEPTTALDVTVQAQILEMLKSLRITYGMSVLLITHDLGIVADICDTVYVMYAGKIVEQADVFDLFEYPKHPYTIGLLKSTLSIGEFKERVETVEGVVPSLISPPTGCRFTPRCPYAMYVCSREDPPRIDISPTHKVSCWLYK